MKKVASRRIIVVITVLSISLLVGYIFAKPHINRLLDNRERAVMSRHSALIQEKIQAQAHRVGFYPSQDEVRQTILESGLASPHTGNPYNLMGSISHIDQVGDSQIGYDIGDYQNKSIDNKTAYFCLGIDLPRTNEGGASCDNFSLDKKTDARIKYSLSCETNWLGFSENCDSSILQDL